MSALYYRHSGKFSPLGIIWALGAGGIAAMILGAVYAYAVRYIPFIIISFLLTLAFGFFSGLAVTMGLVAGKVRNNMISMAIGLFVGLFALYFSWAVWAYALLSQADVPVSLFPSGEGPATLVPSVLWTIILEVNERGVWSLKGSTPTGGALWFFWFLEACTIVGLTVYAAYSGVANAFCEGCQEWTDEIEGVALLGAGDAKQIKSALETRDFSFIEALGPPDIDGGTWTKFNVSTCPKCPMTNTLTVKQVTVKTTNKGTETDEKGVLTRLNIDADHVETIRGLGQKMYEELQTEADAAPEP